jgi:hypothetical protein
MFSWFKRPDKIFEALVRSYEAQIGFLKSQLEYEQQKSDELLNLIHTQAGLIKNTNVEVSMSSSQEFQALETGARTWSQTRREIENAHSSKEKEIRDYIAANESVIDGVYNPDSTSTN